MKFPKGFLFGSATSGHQTEGGKVCSDWREWEKLPGRIVDGSTAEVANDSWNKWREDIELLKQTHQNAYRFSIEWARVEPSKGRFDLSAIEHYREILVELRKNNIKSMVTLFHFALPKWVGVEGGFLNNKTGELFAVYCEYVGQKLGDLVDLWVTINEPQTYALSGYVDGIHCPGQKNFFTGLKIGRNLNRAHILAYKKLRTVVSNPVGIVENIAIFEPLYDNIFDKTFVKIMNNLATISFIAPVSNHIDFLGINYYFKVHVRAAKPRFTFIGKKKNDIGWGIVQAGLYQAIRQNQIWRKPIYITENGVADAKDIHRPKFLKDALFYLSRAIRKGADVRGYFHWTLMDNFEWASGYTAKFGLFTRDRKPRKSATVYRDLIDTSTSR
ncbi:MAG: glycoside hydrolase family 1 protein [Candidatus Berkelbacteria bacterium]